MTVRGTTREAYKKLSDLGKRQQEVFNILKRIEPATDRDISNETDMDIRSINARRGELERYGFIAEHGTKIDPATNRRAITWVTSDPMAQRQIEKAVGKPPKHTEEKKSVNKFTLRLKNSQIFTISEPMKVEIEAAINSQRGNIEIAGHVFAISNIALPIREQTTEEDLAPVKNEETRTEVLISSGDKWIVAEETDSSMRRSQKPFRTRRIGVESGRVHYDMLTHFRDGYETLRDMKGEPV